VVWIAGGETAVPRFWLTVLLSGFACYVSLPWLLSRPPRITTANSLAVGRLNAYVLSRVSHTWTTFPSGHVAVSWAAAFAVMRVCPVAGWCVALVAAGVTVGAAAGRYHFVVDVLIGMLVAVLAAVIT
jgi:hypothetical protein